MKNNSDEWKLIDGKVKKQIKIEGPIVKEAIKEIITEEVKKEIKVKTSVPQKKSNKNVLYNLNHII